MAGKIVWTAGGRRSYKALLKYLSAQPDANPKARGKEISAAIRRLRDMPLAYAVRYVRNGRHYRQLVVNGRFLVFYLYFPARGAGGVTRISIRAVKHSARQWPFAGVREPSVSYGAA